MAAPGGGPPDDGDESDDAEEDEEEEGEEGDSDDGSDTESNVMVVLEPDHVSHAKTAFNHFYTVKTNFNKNITFQHVCMFCSRTFSNSTQPIQ